MVSLVMIAGPAMLPFATASGDTTAVTSSTGPSSPCQMTVRSWPLLASARLSARAVGCGSRPRPRTWQETSFGLGAGEGGARPYSCCSAGETFSSARTAPVDVTRHLHPTWWTAAILHLHQAGQLDLSSGMPLQESARLTRREDLPERLRVERRDHADVPFDGSVRRAQPQVDQVVDSVPRMMARLQPSSEVTGDALPAPPQRARIPGVHPRPPSSGG